MAPNPLNASATFPCTEDRQDASLWVPCLSAARASGVPVGQAAACCDSEMGCTSCPELETVPKGGPRKRAGRGRSARRSLGSPSGTA